MNSPKPFKGFNRVVISYEGDAVSMERAIKMGFSPDVGFMRKDGWSLGAPSELEDVAFRLWADEWTHQIRKPDTKWTKLKT